MFANVYLICDKLMSNRSYYIIEMVNFFWDNFTNGHAFAEYYKNIVNLGLVSSKTAKAHLFFQNKPLKKR